MRGTQAVILVMVGVLILYLIWAQGSPLNRPAAPTGTGNRTPTDGQPVATGAP